MEVNMFSSTQPDLEPEQKNSLQQHYQQLQEFNYQLRNKFTNSESKFFIDAVTDLCETLGNDLLKQEYKKNTYINIIGSDALLITLETINMLEELLNTTSHDDNNYQNI